MNFIPNTPKNTAENPPWYEDATAADGWEGQATTKSLDTLEEEVAKSIRMLGGMVVDARRGTFELDKHQRQGYQIFYTIRSSTGATVPGRVDVAALPCRRPQNEIKSLRMALYMLRIALNGTRFLQLLSPGYSALMPFMLVDKERTVTQMWAESSTMRNLLPPGDSDFTEGEVRDI